MENKIIHIEIPCKDVKKAKKFYESVFKWEIKIETGFPGYAFFKSGEEGVGGALQESEKIAKGEINLNIQVEDIPKALEIISKNGGKTIQEKTEIGNDYGFYAVFEDNSGNILGLWSQK